MVDVSNIRVEDFKIEGARRRMIWFAQYVEPKFCATPFHRAYYEILDRFAHGRIRRLIIQAPPQSGKSQGSSRFLPAFMAGLNPDMKIALASYAATIANGFNRDVQRIIDSEEYQRVFPKTYLNGMNGVNSGSYVRNTDLIEFIDHSGSFYVVGRGGALTSRAVDCVILDDLYKDYKEGSSPVVRAAVWEWYTSTVISRLGNGGQQLIVFTRWNKEDVIGKILETEKHIFATTWEELENVPDNTWVVVNFEALKTGEPTEIDPREPGAALWPERHSRENLLERKRLDGIQFQCLYQGNPGDDSGKLFQPFKTWVNKSDWGTPIRKGCYIDVADSGSDYLAAATYDIYKSEEMVWNENKRRWEPLLYALITALDFTDADTEVTSVTTPRMINEQGTEKVWVESNNGGSQFEKTIKKKIRALTVPFYQGANKESRIITSAAFVNQAIIMPFGWEHTYPKFYRHITDFLRKFDANEHDDGVDMLVGVWEKEIADGNAQPYGRASRGVRVRG